MRALDDLFVVDLSRVISGPICTMMLADMGARVIKVEPPPHGDDSRLWGPPFVGGISTYFHSVNRNKKSVGLNLKTEAGCQVLRPKARPERDPTDDDLGLNLVGQVVGAREASG